MAYLKLDADTVEEVIGTVGSQVSTKVQLEGLLASHQSTL